jgi:hypothetical protein
MQQVWELETEWELQACFAYLAADSVACPVHHEMAAGQETFLVASDLAEDTKVLLQPEEGKFGIALALASSSFHH